MIWPDFVRERVTDYPGTQMMVPRLKTSPAQISQLDEVLGWMLRLEDDERQIVDGHLAKAPRMNLARTFDVSSWVIGNRFDAAAREIATQLLAATTRADPCNAARLSPTESPFSVNFA